MMPVKQDRAPHLPRSENAATQLLFTHRWKGATVLGLQLVSLQRKLCLLAGASHSSGALEQDTAGAVGACVARARGLCALGGPTGLVYVGGGHGGEYSVALPVKH
jgi:hypothetical protein